MNERQVKLERVYTAKVTNREVSVRIDEKHPDGGWKAINLSSGKPVRVKTAARLGREVTKAELKSGKAPGMQKAPVRRSNKKPGPPKTTNRPTASTMREGQSSCSIKLSGLDAAHKVLQESDAPLTAREIVDQAAANGYWNSNAATPQATIHAAMSREIKQKGDASRFKKAGRGKFGAR
jgi:hypothetical protein